MSPAAVAARLAEVGALNRLCDSLGSAGRMSGYRLPDLATMAMYMRLLQRVLVALRQSPDQEAAELANAVHDLPDLLMRWPDMKEGWVAEELRRFEDRYPRWTGHFTGVLELGAAHDWQLVWRPPRK